MKKNEIHTGNGLMSEHQFRELSKVHALHCISIYIPTHRAGQEVDAGQGQSRLRNSIKELKKILQRLGLKENEINQQLAPLKRLLEDLHFWRNQSDGLAIYLHGGQLQHFTLPIHFKDHVYVADHFYLKPVIPFFNDDGRFYILALSLQHAKLFECSRHTVTEVNIVDLVPERLEDVVGYDYQEKSLQQRSGQGGEAGVMFHGQGAGKEDAQQEAEKFFRAVDAGLMKIIQQDDVPLILACVDHHYPVYREITAYPNLFEGHLSGNPEQVDPVLLHEEAWMLVEDYFRQQRKKKTNEFRDLSASGRTASSLIDIIPASFDGRVDTLFICQGKDRYGRYEQEKRLVIVDEDPGESYHASLYNMAAVNTLKNSGRVYLSEPGHMPLEDTEINALMRY
jgi:hypothetical protein